VIETELFRKATGSKGVPLHIEGNKLIYHLPSTEGNGTFAINIYELEHMCKVYEGK